MTEVQAFFSRYPNAKDVFVVDGKAYLNQFEQLALQEAKSKTATLVKIDAQGNEEQVWPPVFTYEAQGVVRAVSVVTCNGNDVSVIGEETSLLVQQAIADAAQAAGVALFSASVSEAEANWNITIESDKAFWAVKDGDGQFVELEEKA